MLAGRNHAHSPPHGVPAGRAWNRRGESRYPARCRRLGGSANATAEFSTRGRGNAGPRLRSAARLGRPAKLHTAAPGIGGAGL